MIRTFKRDLNPANYRRFNVDMETGNVHIRMWENMNHSLGQLYISDYSAQTTVQDLSFDTAEEMVEYLLKFGYEEVDYGINRATEIGFLLRFMKHHDGYSPKRFDKAYHVLKTEYGLSDEYLDSITSLILEENIERHEVKVFKRKDEFVTKINGTVEEILKYYKRKRIEFIA